MPFRLRDARPQDATAAGQVVLEAYLALPGYVSDPEYEVELADVGARLPPAAEVVVAEGAAGIVGCVTYVPGPESPLAEGLHTGEAGIRMLGVVPAAQRAGVGRALVQACIQRARAGGRAALHLHSTDYMPAAHRLYRSLGFARTPERDWSPYDGLELVSFTLELPAGCGERPTPRPRR